MEEFNGDWFGVGIVIGFLGACLCYGALKLTRRCMGLSKSSKSWTSTAELQPAASRRTTLVWQPANGTSPTTVALAPIKTAPQGLGRSDIDTMGDNRKAGPLQTAMQSPAMQSLALPRGAANPQDVQLTIAPPAPAHVSVGLGSLPGNALSDTANASHKRGVSTASMYDTENLDDEWTVLLESVDSALTGAGRPIMTVQERAVAVRKLVAVTGTRGMEGAITAAVDEIVRFRTWNPPQGR